MVYSLPDVSLALICLLLLIKMDNELLVIF